LQWFSLRLSLPLRVFALNPYNRCLGYKTQLHRKKIKNPANQPGFDVWYESVLRLKAQPEQEGDTDYQHGATGQQV
jgi:hypothetical protein